MVIPLINVVYVGKCLTQSMVSDNIPGDTRSVRKAMTKEYKYMLVGI